jgi:hypothetical protein
MLYIGHGGTPAYAKMTGSKDKLTKWAQSKPRTAYKEICISNEYGKLYLRLKGEQAPF